MKTGTFLIIVIIVVMSFSVYAYKLRTAYNIDDLTDRTASLENDIEVLSYALSIVPKETKGDVFFNSIKEKFPYVEDNDDLIDLVRMNKPEKTDEKEKTGIEEKTKKKKEKRTIASTMDNLMS